MSGHQSFAKVVALLPLIAIIMSTGCTYAPYSPPPVAFSDDSSACKQTVVVPTLDTPAPKGKNVIWCATFQLCWSEYNSVIGAVDVPGAQDMIRRLNAARTDSGDLPPGGYYVAAGWTKDGIIKKIQADMAAKFPGVTPNLPVGAEALAYAYLTAALKFRTPYFGRESGDDFIDSAGHMTHVSSFGLNEKDPEADINATLGRQMAVLYCGGTDELRPAQPPRQFVLDLDKNSSSTQLILACVEPRDTLAATWREVDREMKEWKPAGREREFGPGDSLAVPNVNYKILHSFKELETGGALGTMQSIDFRLDRSGATLVSEASMWKFGGITLGRRFSFTRPFLIALRKRGSAEPYFVMWVDNAELLCKP